MDCPHCQDLFSAYADQDLDPRTRERFEGHLASCPGCATEWDLFGKVLHCLSQVEPLPAPAGILPGIHEKLDRPTGLAGFFRWFRKIDFSLSIPAASATIAVAVLTAVVFKNMPADHAGGPNPSLTDRATIAQKTPAPSPRFALKQYQTTPVVSYPGGTTPRQRSVTAYPFSTYDFLNMYMDLHRRPGQTAGDDAGRPLAPDLLVSVQPESQPGRINLYHSLITSKQWETRLGNDDLLIITLPPKALPELRRTLARHKVSFFPPEAAIPYLGARKNMLTVAVRLQ